MSQTSQHPMPTIPTVFPVLRYADAQAAIDWLENVAGFRSRMIVPGPEGSVVHAELSLGSGYIMLASSNQEQPAQGRARSDQADSNAYEIYVYVHDIDGHYAFAQGSGAEIVRELANTDYGSREYSLRDPEGHLWSFGTYLPPQ